MQESKVCHQVRESFNHYFSHNKFNLEGRQNKNLLGIAIMLLGRYGGHIWQRFWFKGVDAREEFPLGTGFWLARLGSKYKS